jgi:hypothetical protein
VGLKDAFPRNFFTAAGKATKVFESFGADWIFVGAVPVAAWGRVRATTDADFAVSLDFSAAFELDQRMEAAGFSKREGPIEIPQKRLVLSKYWYGEKAGLGIDVFFITGYDAGQFLVSALSRKTAVRFFGKDYWAASAEDLVVLKILAFRSKDLDDVASVLEKMFDDLDWRYIHEWSLRLGLERLLGQVVFEWQRRFNRPGPLPWE